MTIYKYPLKVTDWQFVTMPENAKILCVQMQYGEPCLWAMVDPDAVPKMRKIHIFGTGHPISSDLNLTHIDTFQMHEGALVFHVFEAAIQ